MNTRQPLRVGRRVIAGLRKLHIFPRLLLVFCVLLLFSTLLITMLNQRYFSREIESTSTDYLSLMAQNAAYRLEREAKRLEDGMALFTQDEQLLAAVEQNGELAAAGEQQSEMFLQNTARIEQGLLRVKDSLGGIKALMLIAGGEQYRTAAGPGSQRGAFFRDLSAFYASDICRGAVEARGYPSWRDSTRVTSRLIHENDRDSLGIIGCVTLSYQVYAPYTRKPLGVLVCCVYPDTFTQVLTEYSNQEGGNMFLVGNGGMLEGINANFSGPPFLRQRDVLLSQVFSRPRGSFQVESDGESLLVSYSACGDFPIRVVNLTYRSHVLMKARQMEHMNLAVLALVMVIGGVGFYFAAVSIAYPVNRLVRTMQRVGQGNFNAVYHPESHDEIGTLCLEFDRMVANMQSLIDQVYVAQIREKELLLSEKSAQLDVLQMQISPHFLYNTLDMIRWECMYEGGAGSHAASMIETFCTLLRMTIKGDKPKESVADSLLHASTYLEVVNFRHTHPIRMETDITFTPERYQLPRLTLQPILENAVRHGFAGEERENRLIRITGRKLDEERLCICLTDNGQGMGQEQLCALRESLAQDEVIQESIGLRNVSQRCRLYYGEAYGLTVDSHPGQGTSVTLTIPADPIQEEVAHV